MKRTGKRLLCFLLALMLGLSLFPASAFAQTQDETHVFTTQPQDTVSISETDLTYTVSWAINFMPTQVDIMRKGAEFYQPDERVGSPLYLNGTGSYELPASADVSVPYYIRAFYSDAETGETKSIVSNFFTLDHSNLVFSLPPTANPALNPDSMTWTVRWATNFTPVRVEAVTNTMGMENYESVNTPYASMTEGLSTSPSMAFDYSTPRTEYYLRAYFTDNLYIVSTAFTIADPEPVFVTQPPPTVGLDADLNFTVSWRTNFIPDSVRLVRDGNELSGVVLADDLSNEMSWALPHTLSTEGTYQIRARKGAETVDSAPFQLSDANMFFSVQPDETISIRLSDLQYVIHWQTTFNPVKIEVMYRDGGTGINSDTVIATVTENLRQEMYHVLFADRPNACAYYIRAYYAEDKFVTSSVFRLSRDNLAFGNQPYDVVIDPDAFAGATSWTLNFLPVKVEVWQDTSPSSWGDLQDRLIDTIHPTDSGQFLYTFFTESSDDHPYYLRAYYADRDGYYVRSENFSLDYSQFRFTKQPVLLDHQDGQNTYTIFWETSYVPERVVIRCDDEEFTYLGRDSIVAELTEDLTKAGSHTFTWEAGKEHDFYVSAYYGSNRTAETATAVEAAFTVQPQSGNVASDVPYSVSWELSGSPTRVELYGMYLNQDAYEAELIAAVTGPDASSIPVDYRTAERYWGELYYLKAWFGEGENDSIESIRFMIRPSLRLNQVFLDTLGSSYAFTEEDRFEDYDDFEAWANLAAGTGDFAYRVRYPQDAACCEINLVLWDEFTNETLSVRYDNGPVYSYGLPADILKPSPAGDAVTIDTTIPELRALFHDDAVAHRRLNPDIFTVYLTVSVRTEWNGWENYSFKLFDTHMPSESYWPDIDFETFTLTTPLTPELAFFDAAPAITSVQSRYYAVLATDVFDCDENPFPADVGDLSWRGYFSPDVYDEELDEWVTVPTAERFTRYFGTGYNRWVEGPANPAPRGPERFICGIAANKLTRSGASFGDASICLADLINSDNLTYFSSLPGLSHDAWFGYYPPETELPGSYEPVYYELLASVEDELTVTFADGVVYRATLPMIQGMESSFQVTGEWTPPQLPPVITAQPQDVSGQIGAEARFTVAAEGSGALTYQWQYSDDGGAVWKDSSSVTDTAVIHFSAARNGRLYRCVVTDEAGQQTVSETAKIIVETAVTAQPADLAAAVGSTVKFTVAASGAGLTYQWQLKTPAGDWKDATATSGKTAKLSVSVTAGKNGYQYRCVITDANGAETISDSARLTVTPKITVQPQDAAAPAGSNVKFHVAASGAALTYQWQYSSDGGATWKNSTASSAKKATLSFTASAAFNARRYRCVVTDANGAETISASAKLSIALQLKTQPQDVTAAAGSTAKFTVTASGAGLTYQWQYSADGGATWKNSTASSARKATLSFAASPAFNARQYRCVVTDANGAETISDTARLTVTLKITAQPQDVTASAGSSVKFTVAASGAGLKYQWQLKTPTGDWKDCTAASGKTASLSVSATKGRNGYQYRCVITDANGETLTSNEVTLTVT